MGRWPKSCSSRGWIAFWIMRFQNVWWGGFMRGCAYGFRWGGAIGRCAGGWRGCGDKSELPRLKNLLGIDDERILIAPAVMELARWIGRYYCAPLGAVLESVIPAAVKKKIGIGYSSIVRLAQEPEKIQEILEKTRSRKRRAVMARMLQVEKGKGIELNRLAGEAGVKAPTVRKLVGLGIVTIKSEIDLPKMTGGIAEGAADEKQIELNEDQRKVFEELSPRVAAGGFSVNLLHGVTGSGKTEVYLQLIAEVIKSGRRALVLVPEIALTPQTVLRFKARFKHVAVLHSGLTATERHRYWQQISDGGADVVVGARSAVFAPMQKLGVIVVDEEHDSSYKQELARAITRATSQSSGRRLRMWRSCWGALRRRWRFTGFVTGKIVGSTKPWGVGIIIFPCRTGCADWRWRRRNWSTCTASGKCAAGYT